MSSDIRPSVSVGLAIDFAYRTAHLLFGEKSFRLTCVTAYQERNWGPTSDDELSSYVARDVVVDFVSSSLGSIRIHVEMQGEVPRNTRRQTRWDRGFCIVEEEGVGEVLLRDLATVSIDTLDRVTVRDWRPDPKRPADRYAHQPEGVTA